ncbi:M16 family metallopeptidase [Cytophaga aurantiaca]|uniref:M16 family metallopeptidase n=1 Tax=Cytophaga aurantiaca TaxID=29530 RepID=UPI00037BD277|nr:pitrilysin family protein [Cytophaga aurantiaca]
MQEIVDRTIAPAINPIDRFHLPKVETVSFSNGNILHKFALGTQPVVRVEWIFNTGSRVEDKIGTSFFTSKMLAEGTPGYTSTAVQEFLAQYGAFLEIHPGNERINITLFCLEKYLTELVPFIKSLLTESIFPEEQLVKMKQIQSQGIQVNQEKTAYLAGVAFRELLYNNNHTYGKHLSIETIAALEHSDLTSFFKNELDNKQCNIILTGGFSKETVVLIEKLFGTDAVKQTNAKQKLPALLKPAREVVIEKEGSVQTSIRYGRILFNHTHEDYFDAYILNEILGGYFGSRLMQNIREEKGYTYGINSSIVSLQEGGYFVIGTDVKREFTKNTIVEIEKELQILIDTLVSENELDTVKNYMLGSFVGDIQTPFSIADKYKTIYYHGLGYDYYDRFFARIQSITAADIQKVAKKYFVPSEMSYVIAGGF